LWDKELRGFATSFVQRHLDFMKTSATKPITSARIPPSTIDSIGPFLDRVSDYALRYAAGGTSWYNVDECRCTLIAESNKTQFIVPAEVSSPSHKRTPSSHPFTLVPFVSACGKLEMLVIVGAVESKRQDSRIDRLMTLPLTTDRDCGYPRYWTFNKTAAMNHELWESIMDKFVAHRKLLYPGLDSVVFLDRLSAHTQPALVRKMYTAGVHLVLLPVHTTHYLQPLDNIPFATVKKTLHHLRGTINHTAMTTPSRQDTLLSLCHEVEKVSFTSEIIQAGWKNVGLGHLIQVLW
jgi:hypothetical protein